MMTRHLSVLLVLVSLSLLALSVSAGLGKNKNAMLLQDVSTLVFNKGEMTNARRSSAQPQLTCMGGKCQYAPESAVCRNIGFDGQDVTWSCEAELPKGVKFGKVEVSCEGFNSRDDEYVLKGSCGLEYTLVGDARFDSEVREEDSWWNRNVRHSAGKHPSRQSSSSWWSWLTGAQAAAAEQYGHAQNYAQHQYDKASDYMSGHHHNSRHHQSHDSFGVFGLVSWLISSIFSMGVKLIAALIVFFVLWKLLRPAASTQQPAARRPGMFRSLLGMFGSGLGGTGYNNYGNSPPPYNPPPYDAGGYDKRHYQSTAQQQQQAYQQQQSGGSGFGGIAQVLGGSLLGYFMGSRRANSQQAAAAAYTQQPNTVHHVHHNAPPVNPAYGRNQQAYPTATATATATRADGRTTRADGSSIEDISDVRTTETSTAYARTKRR